MSARVGGGEIAHELTIAEMPEHTHDCHMDDDNSVSDGDVRATPVGAFLAGSTVSAGPPPDADVGTALVSFTVYKKILSSL